jgi:hypothetical protein
MKLKRYPNPKAPMKLQTMPHGVWCDVHGEVHEPIKDLYGEGNKDCRRSNWRTLLIRAPLGEFTDNL